ncbi:kelch-like protein 9 [Menidia menidia]
MAVAHPCHQKEWNEWKRKMENRRRRQWRERVRHWADAVEDHEEKEDEEGKEGEDSDSSEEDECEKGKRTKEIEKEDSDEEGQGGYCEERLEGKLKAEQDRDTIDEDDGLEMQKPEEDEGQEDVEREMVEEEDGEVCEAQKIETYDDGLNSRADSELDEEEQIDLEGENDSMRETEENEDSQVDMRQIGAEKHSQDDDSEGEQQMEQSRCHFQRELQDHTSREYLAENIQNHSTQEDAKCKEDDFSDSGQSVNSEDSETESKNEEEKQHNETQDNDSEELEGNDNKNLKSYSVLFEAWTMQDRNEKDGGEKVTDNDETVKNSWVTQKEFQDDCENFLEGFSEAECSTDEEEEKENDEEDDIMIYCKDDYPTKIFQTLNEFKDSAILTDLTLNADDGKSFCVHSPVLAAVSSLICKNLCRSKMENNERVRQWSLSFGPDLQQVGLGAIVEFAYTGFISCLNKDNMEQIKAAGQILGAPRVLKLCVWEEEQLMKAARSKREEMMSAQQQLTISLQFIKHLWMDKVGCDVILEAAGGWLHVHRVVLAASSDYFRGMFTLGMKESHQLCVSLPLLLASELEVLICSSYSGTLPINWTNVFEITTTALQLQYQPALSLCFNFLLREINPKTCLDVISFAQAYEIRHLLEFADDFVLRQFQKVACTSKFKDLPAKQLLKYLSSHSLCVPSELVVFSAVVAWIQAKPRTRLGLAKDLMKKVYFPLMTFKEFQEVRSHDIWSDNSLTELYEAVFENFCSSDTAQHSRIYLPKESLVLTGGDHISEDLSNRSISREVWFGNSLRNHEGIKKAMEWRRLGEMPEAARFTHEVAVLHGQLYVFGGKKYYGTYDTLNSVHRYDPHRNNWEALSEMQEKRCSFSVAILDGKIYAIGGLCEPDHIESVESYCPNTNTWSFTWPLDLPLSGHVAKVAQEQIFISGGRNGDYLCLSSMFRYQPDMGSTYMANMSNPRALHCMESLGDCLYVAGGITTHDNMIVIDQLTCEMYNPTQDSWTCLAPLPLPHVGAGSAILEGKFYVLGGYSQENYSDTKLVHRYDATTNKWENMGKMPGPNNDLRACVLCLPQHVRL